jgi:hypothetical protein
MSFLRHRLRDCCGRRFRGTAPHQPATIVNNLRVSIQDGVFEILQVVVLKVKLPLEGTIRHPLVALEPGEHL